MDRSHVVVVVLCMLGVTATASSAQGLQVRPGYEGADFCRAVELKDRSAIEFFLEQKIDVNQGPGYSAFKCAMWSGDLALFDRLLKAGGLVDQDTLVAAEFPFWGAQCESTAVLDRLLRMRSWSAEQIEDAARTAGRRACRRDVNFFIAKGADIRGFDRRGQTVLQTLIEARAASLQQRLEFATFLLDLATQPDRKSVV